MNQAAEGVNLYVVGNGPLQWDGSPQIFDGVELVVGNRQSE